MSLKFALLILLTLPLAHTAHAGAVCFKGTMDLADHGNTISLKFEIKDTILKVTTDTRAFEPGPPVTLVAMPGDRCATCTALQSEKGDFTFVYEPTETGAMRTIMNYYDLPVAITDLDTCAATAPKAKN